MKRAEEGQTWVHHLIILKIQFQLVSIFCQPLSILPEIIFLFGRIFSLYKMKGRKDKIKKPCFSAQAANFPKLSTVAKITQQDLVDSISAGEERWRSHLRPNSLAVVSLITVCVSNPKTICPINIKAVAAGEKTFRKRQFDTIANKCLHLREWLPNTTVS